MHIKQKVGQLKNNALEFFERKWFFLYFSAKIFLALWSSLFDIPRLAKLNGLRVFSVDEAKKWKKSDTLFILGGGSSINSLTEEQWLEIKSSDSIGINFWFIHQHKPTFMLIEGFRESDTSTTRYKFFYNAINAINAKYFDVPFLIKDINHLHFDFKKFPQNILKNSRVIPKLTIPGSTNASVRRSLSLMTKLNYRPFKDIPYSSRASISFAISLAKLIGYKKIVLCGVDLDGSSYFWESSTFQPIPGIGVPETTGQKKGSIHSTIDPLVNPILIDEVIYDMQASLSELSDSRIYISSKSSKLHPRLPYYWEKKPTINR